MKMDFGIIVNACAWLVFKHNAQLIFFHAHHGFNSGKFLRDLECQESLLFGSHMASYCSVDEM